jgi:hypothetical protein
MAKCESKCTLDRLLALLAEEPVHPREQRLNPLDILDLLEAGLVECNPDDGTVTVTAEGRRRIGL